MEDRHDHRMTENRKEIEQQQEYLAVERQHRELERQGQLA